MDYWHGWPLFLIGVAVGAVSMIVLAVVGVGIYSGLWRSKIEFYLYFADEAQAQPAIADLRREGFEVKSRLSGDEQQWLLLATKAVRASELDIVEAVLEGIATAHGGEYDGFERAV